MSGLSCRSLGCPACFNSCSWVQIPEFPYEVAPDGSVRNAVTGRVLRTTSGWVTLCRDGREYNYRAGQTPRLTFKASASIPIPLEGEWTPIPSFPMYQIHRDGRVARVKTGRILRVNGGSVALMRDGKPHTVHVNALLTKMFPAPLPEGTWVPLPEFHDYRINEQGVVINARGHILKPFQGAVMLSRGGKGYSRSVRRLRASAFPELSGDAKSISYVGQTFGSLTVTSQVRVDNATRLSCVCECGAIVEISQSRLHEHKMQGREDLNCPACRRKRAAEKGEVARLMKRQARAELAATRAAERAAIRQERDARRVDKDAARLASILREGEAWTRIAGFNDYAVSTEGRVLSIRYGRLITPDKKGFITLRRDGRGYNRLVRATVARAFSPEKFLLTENFNRRNLKHGLARGIQNVKPDPFYTVYCLIDPRDFSPFYVGATRLPKKRRYQHRREICWATMPKRYQVKMQELRAAGVKPLFDVLEQTTDPSREEWHIKEITRLGYTLVNKHKTGVKTRNYLKPAEMVAKPRIPQSQTSRQMTRSERRALSAATRAMLSWNAA